MNTQQQQRLMSLDTLRGFDMLFIMGFASIVVSVCKLFPEGADCWLAQQMAHVQWNGFAQHDTIFPLFLFIAGISWPFSYSKQLDGGSTKKQIYLKILKRAAILVFLGVVYNGFFKLDFENLRICSVLGRIGLAWGIGAILYINFKPKTLAFISGGILLVYWALLALIPAPDMPGADRFSLEGNLVGYIDRLITPGKLLTKDIFDPEGLLSTVPAVVTALLGMLTGTFVKQPDSKINGNRKTVYMLAGAVAMAVIAILWNQVFPVNKKLWTSSFVMAAGAYSLGLFALFYYIIDVRKWQKWTLFFRVIGLNSITIYLAQRIFKFDSISKFFLSGLASKLPEQWSTLLLQCGFVAVSWLFLYFLYKKKVFLKV